MKIHITIIISLILGSLISAIVSGQTTITRQLSEIDALNSIATANQKEIAFGNIPDREGFTIIAYNPDLDTANGEIISQTGQNVNAPPVRTAASYVNVASASANDTSAGTGARILILYGIDENFDAVTEYITMNGVSNVQSAKRYWWINRAAVTMSGTGAKNAGNITITHITDSYVMHTIAAGFSVTASSVFMLSANQKGFIGKINFNSVKIAGGTDPKVVFSVKVYNHDTKTIYTLATESVYSPAGNFYYENFKYELLRPKEIMWIEAVTTQNDTTASARVNITLANYEL